MVYTSTAYVLSTVITVISGHHTSPVAIAAGTQVIDSPDGKKVCQLMEKRFHRGPVTVIEGVSFSERIHRQPDRNVYEKRESYCTPIVQ